MEILIGNCRLLRLMNSEYYASIKKAGPDFRIGSHSKEFQYWRL